jgi:manganese/iron transport system substrate-binding protein
MMGIVFQRICTSVALFILTGALTSCTTSIPILPTSSTEKSATSTRETRQIPKVVATTTILCDMTKRIAAETIELICLLQPGVDAHVYEATPQQRKAIEDAHLILYSGYNFEPDLIQLIQSTSNPAARIAVAEKAVPQPLMGGEHDHGHGQEDNPPPKGEQPEPEVPDPHVWQNAANGSQMATVIQQELAKLVPEQASIYARNAKALTTELTQIHTWIQAQIATIPAAARKLVTTHDAMTYYSHAYHIPVEGALQGLSTEEKPTAKRIKELVDEVKAAEVRTIFAELVVNPKVIQAVARAANVKVSDRKLYSDSLGEPGSEADTYPKLLIANTKTIVQGLGGQYTAFQLR